VTEGFDIAQNRVDWAKIFAEQVEMYIYRAKEEGRP
jgi:hypothetical protein